MATKISECLEKKNEIFFALKELTKSVSTGMKYESAKIILDKLLQHSENGELKLEKQFLREKLNECIEWEKNLDTELKLGDCVSKPMEIDSNDIQLIENELEKRRATLHNKMLHTKLKNYMLIASTNFIKMPDKITELADIEKKAAEWNQNFEKTLAQKPSFSEFQLLIENMSNCRIRTQQMDEALNLLEEYLKTQFAVNVFLTQGLTYDIKTGETRKEEGAIENIIKMSEGLKIQAGEEIEKLKKLKQEVQEWKEKYEEKYKKEENIKLLNEFLNQGINYKILLPEITQLQTRIELLESIDSLTKSSTTISYDYLTQIMFLAKSLNLSESLLTPLKLLITEAEVLINKYKGLIEQCSQSYNNINQLTQCFQELSCYKVELPILHDLQQIVNSYKWQSSLSCNLGREPSEVPEYEQLENASEEELEKNIVEAESVGKLIGPASKILIMFKQVLWYKKAQVQLDPSSKFSDMELKQMIEQMHKAELNEQHPRYGELCKSAITCEEKYNSIISVKDELQQLDLETLTESKIEQILDKICQMKQNAFVCQVNLKDCMDFARKFEQWLQAYQELIKILSTKEKNLGIKLNPTQLNKAYKKCLAYAEDNKTYPAMEKAKKQIEKYKTWTSHYAQYCSKKTAAIKDEESIYDLDFMKKMIVEAASIDLDLEQEVKVLTSDIEISEVSQDEAQKYLVALRSQTTRNAEEISNMIEKLRKLPLYSKNLMLNLKAYLWLLQVKTLSEGQTQAQYIKKSIDEWTTLIKQREKMLNAKVTNDTYKELLKGPLIEELVNQHREALILMNRINGLKKKGTNSGLSFVDLTLMLELLRKSKINFQSEIEFVQTVIKDLQGVEVNLKELKEQKAFYKDFQELGEKIEKESINYGTAEAELSAILSNGNALLRKYQSLVKDSQKKKTKISHKDIEDLLVEYGKLPCKIEELEEAKEKFDQSKKIIEKCKEMITSGGEDGKTSLELINQVSKQLKDLAYENQAEEKTLKLAMWQRKYGAFISDIDKISDKPTFNTLRGLISDFDEVRSLSKNLDNVKFMHLKQLIEEARKDINTIHMTYDFAELKRLESSLACKYVDYSEFLIEQQARLTLNPSKLTTGKKRGEPERSEGLNEGTSPAKRQIRENLLKDESGVLLFKKQEAAIREKSRTILVETIQTNNELIKSEKAVELLGEELEAEIFNEYKETDARYKERITKVCSALKYLNSYRLLSGYIASGKLALWKICKIENQKLLIQKMKRIEALVARKIGKKKEEEQRLQQIATGTPSSKEIRLNSLLDEDKSAKMESPLKYDIAHLPVAQEYSTNQQKEKNNDDDSLESVEVAGGKVNYGQDEVKEAMYQQYPEEKFTQPLQYQPVNINQSKEDEPYNPLNTDFGSIEKKTTKKPIQPVENIIKPKPRSILIPKSYDPNSVNIEQEMQAKLVEVPPGSLLKIWTGTLESGKLIFECEMHTNEGIQGYYTLPDIVDYISIDGRAKISEVMQYIDTNAGVSKVQIHNGWVIPQKTPEAIENIDKYIQELESTEKCGVIDIKEMNSHIYLIPWVEKYQGFLQKWRIQPVSEQPNGEPFVKLAYFIVFKKRDTLGVFKPMNPTLIRKIEPSEQAKGLVQAEELSEEGDRMNDTIQNPNIPEQKNPNEEANNRIKEVLKEKIKTLTHEELQIFINSVGEEHQDLIRSIIMEMVSPDNTQPASQSQFYPQQMMQPPEPRIPIQSEGSVMMQNLADDPGYHQKVSNVQGYLEKNRAFFVAFMHQVSGGGHIQQQNPSHPAMAFPVHPPPAPMMPNIGR